MTLIILGLVFVALMTLGVPISFSVGIASVVATLLLPGVDNATIVQRMLTSLNTFPLLAVIFFVFAGTLMARGGVAIRLVRMAEVLVGWLPGSLAQIVVVASMFFGGVTGSAVAEVSSIGSMMIPGMVKDGYSRRFATAIVLTAATMGPIIPPSIGMIIFAHIAGSVSIAALFLAVFVYQEIKWRDLPEIIWQCCLTNAVVMLLIATCSVFSWILTYENLPRMLADNFFNLIPDKWAFLLILNLFLLVVGMFVDMTPALIMLVPILLPLALKFDISLVHLGLIM